MGFDYKEWYDKHKGRLAAARKARYDTDPAYRDKVQGMNRAARARKQVEEGVEKRAEDKAKKVEVEIPWKQVEIDGVTYLTIGALARVLGRSVKTLRLWESRGKLPLAERRSSRGDRLYSPDQVLQIHTAFEADGKVSDTVPEPRATASKHLVQTGDQLPAEMMLFRVATLSKIAGRSLATILQLEERGRFPRTSLRSLGGQRLYTMEMIEAAKQAFQRLDKTTTENWEDFYQDLRSRWDVLGILDARVVS